MMFKKLDNNYKTLFYLSAVFSFILPFTSNFLSSILSHALKSISIRNLKWFSFIFRELNLVFSVLGICIVIYALIHHTQKESFIVYLPSLLRLMLKYFHPISAYLLFYFFEIFQSIVLFYLLSYLVKYIKNGRTELQTYLFASLLYQLYSFVIKIAIYLQNMLKPSPSGFFGEVIVRFNFPSFFLYVVSCCFSFIINLVIIILAFELIKEALQGFPHLYHPKIRATYNMKSKTLRISRAGIEQADEMGSISALSWKAAYVGIVPGEYLLGITSEKRAEKLCNIIPNSPDEYYLAKVQGVPAGVLVIGPSKDSDADDKTGELCALYFLPEYWEKGFGMRTHSLLAPIE